MDGAHIEAVGWFITVAQRGGGTGRGEGPTTNEIQLRVLTGWLNRSDRASALAFSLYRRGLYRLDRHRRLLGFDASRYARFERWRASTDGVSRLNGFTMRLERGDALPSADYRYLPEAVGSDPNYEPEVTAFLRARVGNGMGFVDVGANSGYFSLLVASLVGPTGRVDAFEPDGENFRRLSANAALNGFHWLRTHPVALGRERATGTLFASPADSGGHSLFWTPGHRGGRTVPIETLDESLPEVRATGFKFDVEGFEEDALRGARETLHRNPAAFVIFEYNKLQLDEGRRSYDGVFDLLHGWGWEVRHIAPDGSFGMVVGSHRDVGAIIANLVATKGTRPLPEPVVDPQQAPSAPTLTRA